uniref:Leucine-rich repeat-containing N-terminal plant-type domain-containing protein n=1 Tax=Solanum lycopersicum TaxID=4081 RepID=A0A3Q7IDD4_SOLLC
MAYYLDKIFLLLAIKNEIIDPFESLITWNESIPLCQWRGVVCGTQNQRVIELNLLDHKLTGVLITL